jgi:hypothetical protein
LRPRPVNQGSVVKLCHKLTMLVRDWVNIELSNPVFLLNYINADQIFEIRHLDNTEPEQTYYKPIT